MHSPYELGVIAHNAGLSAFTNPYMDSKKFAAIYYLEWFDGWHDAKRHANNEPATLSNVAQKEK